MTDSIPQCQRATPADLEWLERIVEGERYEVVRDFPLPLARRILNSLRATPAVLEQRTDHDSLRRLLMNAIDHFCQTEGFAADAEHVAAAADEWANQFAEHHPAAVPDREALARALYVMDGGDAARDARERFWNTDIRISGTVREHWLGEADRLVRVLGGFPAAPQQAPFGYVIEPPSGMAMFTWFKAEAAQWRASGYAVTAVRALEDGNDLQGGE